MRRGNLPNLKRHRLIAKLRAAGMSYQAIADQLGVSAQADARALAFVSLVDLPLLGLAGRAVLVDGGTNITVSGAHGVPPSQVHGRVSKRES
jgi:hypothetical protein